MTEQRSLRILQMCSSNSSSGAENHVLSLAQGLLARGHEVLVAVPPAGWLSAELERREVPLWTLKMKDLDYWISIVKFVSKVRARRIEVIHAHLSRAACIAHAVGRLTRVPVVVTAHVHNTARIYKRLARKQNRIVAVSGHVTQLLQRNGVPSRYIETVYHGTNFAELPADESGPSIRAEFDIPADREIIGLVGKVCRDKGQLELVRALDLIRPDFPNVHLMLVGRNDPAHFTALKSEIAALGLAGHVTFTGVRQDVARLIDGFTVCVLPSYMETFGLAAIEASARGKAVVASRFGALPEVVQDGLTGILVDLNPDSISAAINSLLQKPETRESMGRAGQLLVKTEFSELRMIEKTEQVYLKCLNGSA